MEVHKHGCGGPNLAPRTWVWHLWLRLSYINSIYSWKKKKEENNEHIKGFSPTAMIYRGMSTRRCKHSFLEQSFQYEVDSLLMPTSKQTNKQTQWSKCASIQASEHRRPLCPSVWLVRVLAVAVHRLCTTLHLCAHGRAFRVQGRWKRVPRVTLRVPGSRGRACGFASETVCECEPRKFSMGDDQF